MNNRLQNLKSKYPSGLIIPIIESDLKSPNLTKTIEELNKCDYLCKIYIALSAEDPAVYEEALRISRRSKNPCEIVWCNKPEVVAVLEQLRRKGLDVMSHCGKGKDLWITIGIASLDLYAFVVHDADIAYYTSSMPTKLLYPVIEPELDFCFSKGYYARVNLENKKIYGRICRLFINPLLEALQDKIPTHSKYIDYLRSFSYTLSGEFAIYSNLAAHMRIPSDWGLEMGMLSELYKSQSYERICEVDLGFYEHKHRTVTNDGLLKTAEDSFITLLRTLTETDGLEVSEPFLRSLQVMYRKTAQDRVRQYHADAMCNNLDFDRHQEESTVEALSDTILTAGQKFLKNPIKSQLPEWLRTISAMPNIREKLRETAIGQ
jgi:glucosyl-3-phosphoglycerate synthase